MTRMADVPAAPAPTSLHGTPVAGEVTAGNTAPTPAPTQQINTQKQPGTA